jgi:OmcA/MtrC family decaheme c-type cytochrome
MHGLAVAMAEELEGSVQANVVITGATADAAGLAKITFTIKNAADNTPVTGRGAVDNAASFGISSLAPKGGGFSYNKWVSYIWRASGGLNQAYRERNEAGRLVEGPPGTYTYTFKQNLGTAKMPADNVAITYDRNRTHRVFVALRLGYAGGNTFDFVPAGGDVTATRDIVEDATCRKCHMATPGHYGPWDGIVKACVTCHAPGNTLANAGTYGGGAPITLEMSVMLHRIHAGRELESIAGLDGEFYDNPNTAEDETADNGPLYILDEE